jgi:hypothetical protein
MVTMLRFGIVVAAYWAWGPNGLAQQKESAKMSSTISVSIASSPQPVPFGGPVPAVVSLRNSGNEPASVLLPYPNPNHLRFECGVPDFAQPRELEVVSERVAPTVIPPGGSYSANYFLNRYFRFLKPGEASIRYRLDLVVNNQDATYEGAFTVRLATVSDDELRAHLTEYASGLRSNRQAKLEAAEALAYLETPRAVPHLLTMLNIDNLEIIAIHSLAQHRSEEVSVAIASMLSHPDSSVVQAALEEIDRLKIPLPRPAIQRLLSSPNANTQWVALGWLEQHPSREDRPLLAAPANSSNAAVRQRALEYSRALEAR